MAYGFTAAEEQSLDVIKQCLVKCMSNDYDICEHRAGGFVGYPKAPHRKRHLIVKDLVKVLSDNGLDVGEVVETRESRNPYTFIRVGDVAINVGAARRGGQGFYPSTVTTMEDAIVSSNARFADAQTAEAMKARIIAKLDAEEIAFLRICL